MRRFRFVLLAATLTAVFGLCIPAPEAAAVTRTEVIDRAQAWVDAGVPYSYSAWYTDPTTGICCYRTDCSGYVSAVWGLSPPGHTTYSFAGGAWDDGVSYVINSWELLPGDALNFPGDYNQGTGHIMLYVSGDFWSGWVEVYEEYMTGANATLHWRAIDPHIYLPIRYVGIEDCTTEVCDGVDNDCDGLVDENATTEVCNFVDDDCDGEVDEDWVCNEAFEPGFGAWRHDLGSSSDIDGDGVADVCARGSAGLHCHLSTGDAFQPTTGGALEALSDDEGFDEFDNYTTIRMADVDGDGRSDVCARHDTDGYQCWLSDGQGFGQLVQGPDLSDENGWADYSNYTTIRMADVNDDGMADVCARADDRFYCWLSDGAAIQTVVEGPAWSDAGGWAAAEYYSTIRLADVDGDGLVDACARSSAGVGCWLFDGAAFSIPVSLDGLADAGNWNWPEYYLTIDMPDIDGDGRADLCARASAGLRCWPSTGDGFGDAIEGPELWDEGGWGSYPYYASIRWGDVTGDGLDDVCARTVWGIFCWPSTGDGFGDAIAGPAIADDVGWLDFSNFATISLADVDGDFRDDVCARADASLLCWLSDGQGFPVEVEGPAWSDDTGWAGVEYCTTIRVQGGCKPSEEVCDGEDNDCDGEIDEGCDADDDDSGDDDTDDDDAGDDDATDPGAGDLGGTDGCGCQSGPAGRSSCTALLLTLGFLLRRRRRAPAA